MFMHELKQRGMMEKKYFIILIFIGVLMSNTAQALEIRIPSFSKDEIRLAFPLDLLDFVMNKSGVNYTIKTCDTPMNPVRIIHNLSKPGSAINIAIMGSSSVYEEEFLPVRFPIYRGLLGHRIFIIHKNHQEQFNRVSTLQDLQKMNGAQGIGWPDIEILESAGLRQHVTAYDNIFRMIDTGNRIDYFSRGINEAFFEVDRNRDTLKNLAIEKQICLAYPYALFFFCGKHDQVLVQAIETGFTKAYTDGSFNTFFYDHPAIINMLTRANLDKRRLIQIPNPLMTDKTLKALKKYQHSVH